MSSHHQECEEEGSDGGMDDDVVLSLPLVLLEHSSMSSMDVLVAGMVCRGWRQAATLDDVWIRHLRAAGPGWENNERRRHGDYCEGGDECADDESGGVVGVTGGGARLSFIRALYDMRAEAREATLKGAPAVLRRCGFAFRACVLC